MMYIVNMIEAEFNNIAYTERFDTKDEAIDYASFIMDYEYGLEAVLIELEISKEDSYINHIIDETVKVEVIK